LNGGDIVLRTAGSCNLSVGVRLFTSPPEADAISVELETNSRWGPAAFDPAIAPPYNPRHMPLSVRAVTALVFVVSAVAATAGGTPENQASPAFAGHWLLIAVSPQREAYDQFWFGTEARVTQTDTTLVIRRVSPPPQREARFTFGAENRNEYLVDGQKIVRDSRATLSRGTLLISTDTTPPEGQRWLSNILRGSLDADGTLVVGDTEICGKGECPSVVTTLRFKRQ
jgi:hypothetical protein